MKLYFISQHIIIQCLKEFSQQNIFPVIPKEESNLKTDHVVHVTVLTLLMYLRLTTCLSLPWLPVNYFSVWFNFPDQPGSQIKSRSAVMSWQEPTNPQLSFNLLKNEILTFLRLNDDSFIANNPSVVSIILVIIHNIQLIINIILHNAI